MTFAIAAAGTGGHVFPGLAVGEALVASGTPREDVLFIGGKRLEASVYPEAGFPFLSVELMGLQRRMTAENLRIPLVVKRAVDRIASELEDRRTGVVLGLGGYVTVPTGLAARRLGVPLCVSEQNAHAGLANRLMSRLAVRSFGAFPETEGMRAAEWVGNPVRASVLTPVTPQEARSGYGLALDRPVLGVFGGSLGAGALNDAVEAHLDQWLAAGIQVLHLVGARNEELVARAVPGWTVVPFEDRMERFYAACDLVIARAGGAVAELTATATPSILVPGTFGSGGHQLANARALEAAGAGVVLAEGDIARLGGLASELVSDDEVLVSMAVAARSLAKPHAAANISAVLKELHVDNA
jgi:UDP-N-acetylglucosamine--N-acetylmuramyl-(pentapeptide) pyrophosphoryl-undecaprenol N-acetylglucosamine transferase